MFLSWLSRPHGAKALLVTLVLVSVSIPGGAQGTAIVTPGKPAVVSGVVGDVAAAGRIRMQVQRIAKLYRQAALGIDAARALRQIDVAIAEGDGEFGQFSRRPQKPAVQRVQARCDGLWRDLRVAAKQTPDATAVERVNLLADELMLHAGKLAFQIEAEAETPVGRLLDLSSRLNMLAQRLARLYLQAHAGDRSQGVMTDIEQARKEFAAGLKELENAPDNSQASREAIALAKTQWIFFDAAIIRLNTAGNEPKAAQNVATSSERIAEVLDVVTAQYVRDFDGGRRG
jgi:hypothetical protein